ncbi:hypothetical protein GCM10027061_19780 [Nesterenkonia suensis]
MARDLGISRGALKEWVDKLGSGSTAASLATPPSTGRPESPSARITRLESELAASRAESRKLAEERDVLRQAAKYFAGETSW